MEALCMSFTPGPQASAGWAEQRKKKGRAASEKGRHSPAFLEGKALISPGQNRKVYTGREHLMGCLLDWADSGTTERPGSGGIGGLPASSRACCLLGEHSGTNARAGVGQE